MSRKASRTRPESRRAPRPAAAPSPVRSRRALPVWAIPLGLAVAHALLALLALRPAPHPAGDNAVYLALARGLLSGRGYHDLFDPAAPPHVQFPPGYPAMVAVALAAGVRPWVGLKVMTVLFSAAAVALSWAWVRRPHGRAAAFAVAALLAVSPGVLALSHIELSDVPFWALTMAALWGWERLGTGRTRRLVLASAATAAAALVRSAGLPLLLAAALWLAWRRRWRQLGIYLLIAVPPAAAWAVWTRAQHGYATLIASANNYIPTAGSLGVSGLLGRVWTNLGIYGGKVVPRLLWDASPPVLVALGAILVAAAIGGWALRLRRPRVAEAMLPLYVGMLLVWPPEWAGERLLLPILPLLLAYAGVAVGWLASRLGVRAAGPVLAAAAVVVLAAIPRVMDAMHAGSVCRTLYRGGDRYACISDEWHDFFAIAEAAGRDLPPGAVAISRKPAFFWLASEVEGRPFPFAREPAAFFAAAREIGARYVLIDHLDELSARYLTPIVIQRPHAFCLVYAFGSERATLLGIRPGAAELADARADPGAAEVDVGFQRCGPEYFRGGRVPPLSPE